MKHNKHEDLGYKIFELAFYILVFIGLSCLVGWGMWIVKAFINTHF